MYSDYHYKFYRGKMTRPEVDFMVDIIEPTPAIEKAMYAYFVEGKTVKEVRVNTSDLTLNLHKGMELHRDKRTVKYKKLFLYTDMYNPQAR